MLLIIFFNKGQRSVLYKPSHMLLGQHEICFDAQWRSCRLTNVAYETYGVWYFNFSKKNNNFEIWQNVANLYVLKQLNKKVLPNIMLFSVWASGTSILHRMITFPVKSLPRRPARPAICMYSAGNRARVPVPSNFLIESNMTVRVGIFTPIANVSVANSSCREFNSLRSNNFLHITCLYNKWNQFYKLHTYQFYINTHILFVFFIWVYFFYFWV